MHDFDLIFTLAGGFAAALVLGYITHRIGLSPIVGYLVAGLLVGPHTPGFTANHDMAEQLAEVGVILLMFGVGLQFHLKELLRVRHVAVPGALVQITIATLLGCVVSVVFGWGLAAGLVFGLAISVASTVVLLRVLVDNNDLHTPAGHIAVGWLVVEDLFTVLVLVLLPVIFGAEGAGPTGIALALLWSILKLTILVGFTFVVGGRVIPWLLDHVAATRSRELFTLTVLVVALGIAAGSAEFFGASMALGAFLAGMVVGRSEFSLRAASEALPMRDAFAVIFFVSVGMLFDPAYLVEAPGLVAATIAIVLIGKPLAALLIVLVLGYPVRSALCVAVALAQIGEFSFILANLGKDLGILGEASSNALVAAAILSISLNPVIYRLIGPVERRLQGHPRLWNALNKRGKERAAEILADAEDGHVLKEPQPAIIVGYGPVGRMVSRLLEENGVTPTIIDLNLDTIRLLRKQGASAVYGDVAHRDTLIEAGVKDARVLILSAAATSATEDVVRLARELNPHIRVFARTEYLQEVAGFREAGADAVFAGEGEIALTMTEFILRQLGATPEQIDRERHRIRTELFGSTPAGSGLAAAFTRKSSRTPAAQEDAPPAG